ncbi:hypothetical protein KEM52_006117 [Ascosphaera acerosa]|nr:hypothetical protein KEM52_006117 [Ascosphaera acerosa]
MVMDRAVYPVSPPIITTTATLPSYRELELQREAEAEIEAITNRTQEPSGSILHTHTRRARASASRLSAASVPPVAASSTANAATTTRAYRFLRGSRDGRDGRGGRGDRMITGSWDGEAASRSCRMSPARSPPPPTTRGKPHYRRFCLLATLVVVCAIGVLTSALAVAYFVVIAPASVGRSSAAAAATATAGAGAGGPPTGLDYSLGDPRPAGSGEIWDELAELESDSVLAQRQRHQQPLLSPPPPDTPQSTSPLLSMPNKIKEAFKKAFGRHKKPQGKVPQEEHDASLEHPDLESQPKMTSNKKLPGTPEIVSDEIVLTDNARTDGTYPRICVLADGTLLASFTRIDGRTHTLVVSESKDGGKTFQEISEISKGDGDVDNAHLAEISAEPQTILAAFRNHDLDENGKPTRFRITVNGSPDGGHSWTFFSNVTETSPPNGVWEPFVRKGLKGDIQLTFSQEFAPDDQRTLLVSSQNRGVTWSKPFNLDTRPNHLRDGMCGITTTRDSANGKDVVVMVMETTRFPGKFDVEGMLSYDDGASYEQRHIVYNPSPNNIMSNRQNPTARANRENEERGGNPPGEMIRDIPDIYNAGAPQVATFSIDGSLICVFMTDEDVAPNSVSWTQHAAIKAVFAPPPRNGVITWGPPIKIADAESYWPGVTAIDERTVMVTYDLRGPRAKMVRWT